VADVTQISIVDNIGMFKQSLTKSLNDILEKLTGEFQKLEDIRAAIAIEKQSLEDLYDLSANTDSRCYNQVKDTILKANHNNLEVELDWMLL